MNKRQGARIFFALLLVVTASVTTHIPAKAIPARDANVSGRAPSELECQAMTTPLGLGNIHPRLSWRLNDPRRGAVQSAYEIRVASSSEKLQRDEADVWDSGKIMSAELNKLIYEYCVDLMGPEGVLYSSYEMVRPDGVAFASHDLPKAFLRSRANSIEGGTSEIMRNILGERVLGLPGDVRTDKDVPWKDVPRSA